MVDIIEVDIPVTVDVSKADAQVGKLKTHTSEALNLTRRLTGSENIREAIAEMQRELIMIQALRAAYRALQVARLAAGDPVAWFGVGVEVVAAGVTAADAFGSYG